MSLSYYRATAAAAGHPPLAPSSSRAAEPAVELAIIGGGFAGLASACALQQRGLRSLAVLEAQALGHGASGRNGGFVFGGYSLDPAALLRQLGPTAARSLYALTREAVGLIRGRIEAQGLACDKIEGGALLADWFDTPASRRRLADQARLLREQFGVHWEAVAPAQLRDWLQTERYGGGLLERDAFHFHPLKYAQALGRLIEQQGGAVHEHSAVTRIERLGGAAQGGRGGFRLHTAQGASLRAAQLLVAGGGYLQGLLPALEAARLPIATYVMVSEPLAPALNPLRTAAAVYDNRFAFDYYRRLTDQRLLWGGRISIREREPRRIAALLKRDLLKVYPQLAGLRIDHAWGGLMSYARHQMPQIGQLAPGLWFAQAFGGHGVAPTTAAGELLADAISGRQALPEALARYGLTPVFGRLGLLAAQARYSWAELNDWWADPRHTA